MMSNEIRYWHLQKMAGLSNSEACEYLGVNVSTLKRWRNGAIDPPKAVLLALELLILKNEKK